MRSALHSARMAPVLLAIACLLPFLSGCDETYPRDLTYPLRTDLIVVKPPGQTPWDTTRPGQQDANIARFNDPSVGGQTLDPKAMSANDRQELDKALRDIFGTPAEPTVALADDEAKQQVGELKLDADTLRGGSKYYRRHCMHCHGVPGDGRGPTGPWINPHPRDYRQGLFKFLSTDATVSGRKPRRQDILNVLNRGIEGTSMPSFSMLSDKDKEELTSYVIHLSLRGEVEKNVMQSVLNKEALEGGTVRSAAQDFAKTFLGVWSLSNAKVLQPAPYPYKAGDKEQLEASIVRGYKLFSDIKGEGSCIACHVDFGRQAPFRYDEWGTLVRPANLTAGVYRGGRRPIDLYWRIRGGIGPSGMPAATLKTGKDSDAYWDVVNFVQALPYPNMLPPEVRDRIYHSPKGPAGAEHARR